MDKICCPMYTISCKAAGFRVSKSQKGVLKKMIKYLVDGVGGKKESDNSAVVDEKKGESHSATTGSGIGASACEVETRGDVSTGHEDLCKATASTVNTTSSDVKQRKPVRSGVGVDPSKPPCKKAKVLRQEQRSAKKMEMSSGCDMAVSSGNVQEQGIAEAKEMMNDPRKPSLGIKIPSVKDDSIPDFLKVGSDGCKPLESFLILPPVEAGSAHAHKLETKWVKSSPPSTEFKETFDESYSLYKKYQMSIHGDEECKTSGFKRFLCDSPLLPKKGQEGWPCDYGSYHYHYRIDGKLVAVGVMDILPKCLSSVYMYYDPSYYFLNLGVYTALKEIELTRKLHLGDRDTFKYYYMGYYIHSCQKMKYKANYNPSYLLCPESYHFVPIESCIPKLELNKYSRLYDRDTIPENADEWFGNCLIFLGGGQYRVVKYSMYFQQVPSKDRKEGLVKKYAELVGPKVASRLWLSL